LLFLIWCFVADGWVTERTFGSKKAEGSALGTQPIDNILKIDLNIAQI